MESHHPASETGDLAEDLLAIVTVGAPPGTTRRRLAGPRGRSLAPVFTGAAAAAEVASVDAKRRRTERIQTGLADGTRKRPPRGFKNPLAATERLACHRLRLQTTPAQHQALLTWMHAGRWGYNRLIHRVQRGASADAETVNRCCHSTQLEPWMAVVPRCVVKNAMLDVLAALKAEATKAARAAQARRWHTPAVWRFRRLERTHHPTESVRLDGANLTTAHPDGPPHETGPVSEITPWVGPPARGGPRQRRRAWVHFGGPVLRGLGPVGVRDSPRLIDRLVADRWLRHEAKLHWDKRRDALYLIVTLRQTRPLDPDPELRDKRVVAMDPGVRHFQTFCDMADGTHGELVAAYHTLDEHGGVTATRGMPAEWTARAAARDRREAGYHDAARWRAQRVAAAAAAAGPDPAAAERRGQRRVHQRRRQWRRRRARADARESNHQREMHYAACGFLWRHWDTVIVSTARFGRMVVAGADGARLPAGVARRTYQWGHYAFRQRLISSAFRRPGKYVVETDEAYTTQTCGLCGHRNRNVNAATVYVCSRAGCGVHIDRDVNGARNIGLRVLTAALAGGSEAAGPLAGTA